MARQTDRFYAELRKSHTVAMWVDVVSPDLETVRLSVTDGSVSVDRTAAIRRQCSITCIDPLGTITPRTEGEILTPYGTEIHPYRGVIYSDGTVEAAPLGVFRLSESSINDSNGGSPVISLSGFDRARKISRDKFKVPYTIPVATNALTAIKDIVKMTYVDAEFDAITTSVATTSPLLFDAAADPWEACFQLAQSMGCEIYFNVEGRVSIHPPPDINALPSPDFTYIEGEGCTMLDLTRKYSDEPGFNGVIVTGESVGDDLPPVRGEAWDDSPTSPTYRLGPYGEVPMFHTDNLAKTTDQANGVAKSMLANLLGSVAQLDITAVVNPAFEANEIVRVKRERSGIDSLYALDAFDIPLSYSGTQSLTLRERRPA